MMIIVRQVHRYETIECQINKSSVLMQLRYVGTNLVIFNPNIFRWQVEALTTEHVRPCVRSSPTSNLGKRHLSQIWPKDV